MQRHETAAPAAGLSRLHDVAAGCLRRLQPWRGRPHGMPVPALALALAPVLAPILAPAVGLALTPLVMALVIAAASANDAAAQEAATRDAELQAATAAPEAVGAEAAERHRCELPADIAPEQELLPELARFLQDGAPPLTIVVLGSLTGGAKSEVRGVAGFSPRLLAHLQAEFAARALTLSLRVETVGRARAQAGELAALIAREVAALKPALVIWQVGRADARQGNPPARFSQSLEEGLDILQQHGIATILADFQFHPQSEALYRTDEYRNYVRWVAGKRDLPLLRRYEMIEHWALSGAIDLDSGDEADQQEAYVFVQECLAYQAARMIMGGAGLLPR